MNLTQFYSRRYTQFYNWWRKNSEPPEIILNAMVSKILLDKHKKSANGIEFIKRGELHRVFGKKIILAAGTIGSPKILLHSGIGPKEHLKAMDIDLVENLPIGENLQDHITTFIDILLNQPVGSSVTDILNPMKALNYFYNGRGPLALAGSDSMGFIRLNSSSEIPDLSFIMLPASVVDDYGLHLRKAINLKDEIWNEYYEPLAGKTLVTILPILLHPKSSGYLRLNSKDVNDPLLINPNYYESKNDIKIMIKGIRIIQKLLATQPMKDFGAELIPKKITGCENHQTDSDDYWECYLRHLSLTMYHPVGTCKVGDYHDETTVVKRNFQVKNIENLFVVDGSVIPNATSANPHALISMLAYKFTHDMNIINELDGQKNK